MAKQYRFERGETVKLRVEFRTPKTAIPANVLIDPSTVSLTILRPGGVSTTYLYGDSDIDRDDTGLYLFPLSLDVDGTYHWRWEGANGPTIKGVASGELDSVRNPNY